MELEEAKKIASEICGLLSTEEKIIVNNKHTLKEIDLLLHKNLGDLAEFVKSEPVDRLLILQDQADKKEFVFLALQVVMAAVSFLDYVLIVREQKLARPIVAAIGCTAVSLYFQQPSLYLFRV